MDPREKFRVLLANYRTPMRSIIKQNATFFLMILEDPSAIVLTVGYKFVLIPIAMSKV